MLSEAKHPSSCFRYLAFLKEFETGLGLRAVLDSVVTSAFLPPAASESLFIPVPRSNETIMSDGASILVVDDDREIRELLEENLTNFGFRPVAVANGR
jgi:hypothetical protein